MSDGRDSEAGERGQAGRESRIECLLAHAGWIRALSRSLLSDSNQADDAEQETWVAALERVGGVADSELCERSKGAIRKDRAWLGAVFRNVVRDGQRSGSRRRRRENEAARSEALPSVAELVERAELQRHVVRAVVELAEPYRSTLLLHFFEELPCEEIARRQEIPGSTVRNRLKRGLDQLRERFDSEHGGQRDAWALALAPLAAPPLGAGVGGPLGANSLPDMTTGTLTATASTGTIAMSFKTLLALSATAALTVGSTGLFNRWTESPGTESPTAVEGSARVELAANQQSQAGAGTASAEEAVERLASATGTQQDDASPRRAVELPNRPVVRGRVLDQHGEPVASASIFVGGRPHPLGGAPKAGMRIIDDDHPEVQSRIAQLRDTEEDVELTDSVAQKKRKAVERELVGGLLPVRPEELLEGDLEPWGELDPKALAQRGIVLGGIFSTDEQGRFEAVLPEPARVFVTLLEDTGLHRSASGVWYDEPPTDALIEARRFPVATVSGPHDRRHDRQAVRRLGRCFGVRPAAPVADRTAGLGRVDGNGRVA